MERATGLEPATSSLGSLHSTTELCPHPANQDRIRIECRPGSTGGQESRGRDPGKPSRGLRFFVSWVYSIRVRTAHRFAALLLSGCACHGSRAGGCAPRRGSRAPRLGDFPSPSVRCLGRYLALRESRRGVRDLRRDRAPREPAGRLGSHAQGRSLGRLRPRSSTSHHEIAQSTEDGAFPGPLASRLRRFYSKVT